MFQSLGRDSGRSDIDVCDATGYADVFQSLGRDSGRSDTETSRINDVFSDGFNRSVAIRVGLTYDQRHTDRKRCVSIARSRFGSV